MGRAEFWQLNNPGVPAFKEGAPPYATETALGAGFSKIPSPLDATEAGGQYPLECYPAYVSEKAV